MFDAETIRFLTDLSAQNSRDWFTENRARYDTHVAAPAKAFVGSLEAALSRHTGGPVTSKLFRIHRDVRFSKDKTPYNTHVHMAWHSADAPLWWMVGLQIDTLVIGYGCFGFEKSRLDVWRETVAGAAGAALDDLLTGMQAQGLRISAPELKRVPAPFAADHPRGALLRHKSLAVWNDHLPQSAAFGDDAPARLARELTAFDPLHRWFQDNL